MRLWHKDLICVLPRQQLLGQWRECCVIAKNIHDNGSPNHILVNKVIEYPIEHFLSYANIVIYHMKFRGYNVKEKSIEELRKNLNCNNTNINGDMLFKNWHNKRYLEQCYYNLQEKFDCGGITEEEWNKISNLVKPILFW